MVAPKVEFLGAATRVRGQELPEDLGCARLPFLARRPHRASRSSSSRLHAAAEISTAMAGRDARAVLDRARRSCRSVTLDLVTKDDFSAPEEIQKGLGLNRHTRQTELGDIDGFISHSWHDDTEEKWAALQEWRRSFTEREGREPRVWIDKFCIDQAAVEEDLACLPVYQAGSREVVILLGKTYLQRVWCVLELLVLSAVGFGEQNVSVFRLGASNLDHDRLLDSFSVHSTQCDRPEDKCKLLATAAARFGDIDDFDKVVVKMVSNGSDGSPTPTR